MTAERKDAVTLNGQPLTLLGPELKSGERAPDFSAVDINLRSFTLADTKGKARIFSVVPSLDTPVCEAMTRRFNQEVAELPDVNIYTISMDLPFALSRWRAASGVRKVVLLSDHRDASFGLAYGTLIKEARLESRAIFVLDEEGVIRHVEYVKEIADQPNYTRVLEVARELTEA